MRYLLRLGLALHFSLGFSLGFSLRFSLHLAWLLLAGNDLTLLALSALSFSWLAGFMARSLGMAGMAGRLTGCGMGCDRRGAPGQA